MKKKIFVIAIVIIMSVMALVGCSAKATNFDKQNLVTELNSYAMLEQFVVAYPDRTSGDDSTLDKETNLNNADRSALWITNELKALGYSAENDGMVSFTYENAFRNNRIETAYNVIFKKDNPNTSEQVVIGAHYDNCKKMTISDKVVGGDGVYNNAVGVIALIQTAKLLKDVELPFDVIFVAFGAEEIDMFGSKAFVNGMSGDDINNTLLMVNYSSVTGGDNIYMYSDEVPTEHNKFFYDTATTNKYNITSTPKNMRPIMNAQLKGSDLMYYHSGMVGDNFTFNIKGINTISYFSCNLTDRSTQSIVEISGRDNIAYTEADSLLTLQDRMGGGDKGRARIASDIDTVIMNTVKALSGDNFNAIMKDSKANKTDYSVLANFKIMQGIGYGILGLSIALIVGLYFILKSKVKPHNVLMDTAYGRVDMSKGIIIPNAPANVAPKEKIDPFDGEFTKKSDNNNPKDIASGDSKSDSSNVQDVDEIFPM